MGRFLFFFLFFTLTLAVLPSLTAALPLSTNSRWIVDEKGNRVKFACVNWASHLETMVAEGLSKQPVDAISKRIVSMGFNCVRFTYPTFLATNDSLANITVRQSFQSIGLNESISGIQALNPSIIDLPLIQAFQAIVSNLQQNNVMVILDNHISKPGWCCSETDGNTFFGDKYFDPNVWIQGLTRMATTFKNVSNVVAMSLRNELRGPRQNVTDWFRYMQKGAEAVHSSNPNVLVILSGLNYDSDLSFLRNQSVQLSFKNKLVFEVHHYGFSDGSAWQDGNPSKVCGNMVNDMKNKALFVLDQGYPLFVSEFGADERGTNVNDNRYMNCFLAWLAENDLDWCLWTLFGSYYIREGTPGLEEVYGLLSWNWCDIRNATYLNRLSSIQSPFQGPGLSSTNNTQKVIFHPLTGLCVLGQSSNGQLSLGSCNQSDPWNYTTQNILSVNGTSACLQQPDASGKPAKLGQACNPAKAQWNITSDSQMQFSSMAGDGSYVCLDADSSNVIVTNSCKCSNSTDNSCDPASQWFKLVDTNKFATQSSSASFKGSKNTNRRSKQ